MSATKTRFPKDVVPARKVHQQTAIVGKNGLTVDALATLEPGSTLIAKNLTSLSYTLPTVTFDISVDLTPLLTLPSNAKHTGVIFLTDADNNSYFVDPSSINNTSKTLNIYLNEAYTSSPSAINTSSNWYSSEAELVNRLQTTSTAVIDNVEFRDVNINVDLDGSSVNIKDSDGDQLEINSDGSTNNILLNKLIDVPHDDIEVIQYTADGDMEIVEVRLNNVLKRTLTFTYNAEGEFQRVRRT